MDKNTAPNFYQNWATIRIVNDRTTEKLYFQKEYQLDIKDDQNKISEFTL